MIFLSCILPFFPGFQFLNMEFGETKETIALYENIEMLKEDDAVYLDWAFGPTLSAELLPHFLKVLLVLIPHRELPVPQRVQEFLLYLQAEVPLEHIRWQKQVQ